MINYVKMTNFRGVSTELDFRDGPDKVASRVQLLGANGARKSTVREAVAFAFTGKDSTGASNPTHLISMGEDWCEVEVQTRKGATLRRTLTRRGPQLQLSLPGQEAVDYTQGKFEDLLCPADVFLSVLVPGYLLSAMTKPRQAAVLSYMLPPVNRIAYMESSVGGPIMKLDYTKRPDVLQKSVAEMRNLLQHEISAKKGELKSLTERHREAPQKPEAPPELALYDILEGLQREWVLYDSLQAEYSKQMHALRLKREDNARVEMYRKMTEAELSALQEVPLPPAPPAFAIPEPQPPAQPALHPEEQRDRCPQCGQAVGLKHREMVRSQNAAIEEAFRVKQEAYLQAHADWLSQKRASDDEHRLYAEKVRNITAANQKVQMRRRELQMDLDKKFALHPLPAEEPQPPKKPAEEFSQERYLEIRAIVQRYYRESGAYESYQRTSESSAQRIAELQSQIEAESERVEWYKAHEEALRVLPGYELTEQKAHLAMPHGFRIDVEDGIKLFDGSGCPYELLSRGQRMRADFEICLKVNSLLQRKVGMVFLDDFDLADWAPLLDEASPNIQIFTAHVEKDMALEVRLGKPT